MHVQSSSQSLQAILLQQQQLQQQQQQQQDAIQASTPAPANSTQNGALQLVQAATAAPSATAAQIAGALGNTLNTFA
jgi:hypothetical protein